MVAMSHQAPQHRRFCDLPEFLKDGDTLVFNQTKVMNARCFAQKESGGKVEVFILGLQEDPEAVPVLVRPAKRIRPGTRLHFPNADIWAEVLVKEDQGKARLAFASSQDLLRVIENDGEVPLPPYIKRSQGPDGQDAGRYQTVYARDLGAVAAPTAGLHFTDLLLDSLRQRGINLCFVTHHVGIGTFKPMTVSDVRDHPMEAETYEIDPQTADTLTKRKREGNRIIAVGTTTTRCLESNFHDGFHPGRNATNHYIFPGYRFRAIDGLITNFHLPGSSLILLVCALMGRDRILDLYGQAIAEKYRFYSYGDAMLLIP